MVLYWTRSYSFIKFLGCETTVLLPNKSSGREVQPLAALYPTAGADPGFFLGGGAPISCSTSTPINHIVFFLQNTSCIRKPQVISGVGCAPPETTRTPVQGGYPRYHSILSPPRRASLLVPLPLDLSASLPPEFCPLPIVCFLFGTWHRAFMQKHCQLEEFINSLVKK